MELFEDSAGQRLFAALTLLHNHYVAGQIENAQELQREAQSHMAVVAMLATNSDTMLALRNMNASLGLLLENIDGNEKNQTLIGEILDLMKNIHPQLMAVRSQCDRLIYPFDHADGQITVSKYVLPHPPDSEDLGGIYKGAGHLLSSLANLYLRSVGRLCEIAELIETERGFEPLEAPAAL
jgi:hypothetical protein